MKRKLVIIESPYAGDIIRNVKYAQLCIKDSLIRGEAPFASHLLYTQPNILNDDIPEERQHGIDAGFSWLKVAEISAIYTDLGISKGMEHGINTAKLNNIIVEFRTLEYLLKSL